MSALQVGDTQVLVQLGNGAGPWAFVEPDGRLGPLLGYGWTAMSHDGLVILARGDGVSAFSIP